MNNQRAKNRENQIHSQISNNLSKTHGNNLSKEFASPDKNK
jgi:hypothetical protein